MDSYLPEDDIELRSHEVQEIISQIPSGFLRWGMTIMFSVIICFLVTAWFVEYPDVLHANVVITTNPAPITLVSRGEGNLTLLKKENDLVRKKELIAYLQTNAVPESVLLLESKILASASFTDSFQGTLGELENDHGTYVRALDALTLYRESLPHHTQILQLNKQRESYLKLQRSLRDQLALSQQELALSREKYKMDTLLFSQKVSAPAEFSKERSTWLQQQRSFSNAEIALINNELQINQINKQVAELELQQKEQFNTLELELETTRKTLMAHIAQWKRSYLFESPSEGRIAYIGFLENDLFISTAKPLFSILQPEGHFLVRAQLPVQNSGKVKKGQRVNIRLNDYPFEQYGMLTGVVASVSLIPNEDNYYVNIDLPNGLMTTYHQPLSFKQQLSGTTEIITEDLRLLERFFFQFRKLIQSRS